MINPISKQLALTGTGRICRFLPLLFVLALHFPAYGDNLRDEPIRPIPVTDDLNPLKVSLGEKLFHDKKLSHHGKTACASCHFMDHSGDDNLKTSLNDDGSYGNLNTPTMFNVRYNHHITWTGKASRLEDQAFKALTNPRHMTADWPTVEKYLQTTPAYNDEFLKIYSASANKENFLNTIVEYERSLVTPNAPFDRWLNGDDSALSEDAFKGYQTFKRMGCITCHQGINIGGNLFQPLGLHKSHFEKENRQPNQTDMGRFNLTNREQDRHVFRVPSLRNVAMTGPWLHDGSIDTLEVAVNRMAEYQLGIRLTREETTQLVAFLESLTGEYNGKKVSD